MPGLRTTVVVYRLVFYIAIAALFLVAPKVVWAACPDWPEWRTFSEQFIQADGRVIDRDAQSVTTSEGQAYALFFALAANDRQQFERLLRWTSDNLAQGDLSKHLPAWQWGKAADGGWKVLDANPASDADLWLSYTLMQAGKLWKHPEYTHLGRALLHNIASHEVVNLPGAGPMLLPAPYGFTPEPGVWRLNPSYLPIQVLRYLSLNDRKGPWGKIAAQVPDMLRATVVQGTVPDWVRFTEGKGFGSDLEKGGYAGYESIRVYLWWGMLDSRDPAYKALREILVPAKRWLSARQTLFEKVHVQTGAGSGEAPIAFYGAWTPYLRRAAGAVDVKTPASALPRTYYDHALSLFGRGWTQYFNFSADGTLDVSWRRCGH
ncbi:MAG: cellulose synthase complex periplasmic endoglucanase BcsZ [Pseudomonadota bacterium]